MKLNDSKCFYPTISGNEIRVCLFVYSGPGPSPVVGCPYSGILPQAKGVGVFVTPLLPHLQREAGEPVRQSQERGYWEGFYGQFNPNTT